MSDLKYILILDDEDDIRELLEMAMEEVGYKCYTTSTIEESRAILAKEDIDLIFIDLAVSDGSGTDLIQHIVEKYRKPPKMVVYSGYVSLAGDDPLLDKIDAIIDKPCSDDEIVNTVKKLLNS